MILLLLLSSLSWSADHAKLGQLFKEVFWNKDVYRKIECGLNIQRFYQLAHSKKIDLSNTYLVKVEDYSGSSTVGVNTYLAREGGCIIRPTPQTPPYNEVGLQQFYNHIFMVADDFVYDFDFTNEPVVLPLSQYMVKMYIERRKWKSPFEWRHTLGNHFMQWFSIKINKQDKLELVKHKVGKIEELYPAWINDLPPGCGDLLVKH